jgi:hypothetical protein
MQNELKSEKTKNQGDLAEIEAKNKPTKHCVVVPGASFTYSFTPSGDICIWRKGAPGLDSHSGSNSENHPVGFHASLE